MKMSCHSSHSIASLQTRANVERRTWTAKLQANKTDDNLLILKPNMGGGHGGASGRYDAIRERAFAYAFIIDGLGAVNEEGRP